MAVCDQCDVNPFFLDVFDGILCRLMKFAVGAKKRSVVFNASICFDTEKSPSLMTVLVIRI